jgi:hypothetical protein
MKADISKSEAKEKLILFLRKKNLVLKKLRRSRDWL